MCRESQAPLRRKTRCWGRRDAEEEEGRIWHCEHLCFQEKEKAGTINKAGMQRPTLCREIRTLSRGYEKKHTAFDNRKRKVGRGAWEDWKHHLHVLFYFLNFES